VALSKKQSVAVVDLNKLEQKASSLKGVLQVYRDQLRTSLEQARKEFGLQSAAGIDTEIQRIADQIHQLQQQRAAADAQAAALLSKME